MTNRTVQRKQRPSSAKGRNGKASKAQQRKRAARRSRFPIYAIGAVILVVLAMVGLSFYDHVKTPATPGNAASTKVVAQVTSVPASALDAVGAGTGLNQPIVIPAGTAPVTSGGKPSVLYIGAEYCPYCAAERWPLVVALSRFGTFSGVRLSSSSSTDVFPSTRTLTFHGSTYTSDLIAFQAVETNTNQLNSAGTGYRSLETPTPEQQRLLQTFDAPPYTSQAGTIPFLLVGNASVFSGSTYHPDVLQGKTWQEIATALHDPTSPIAEQVLASANLITAEICQITDGQPTNVCTAPGVAAAAATLPKA